MPGHVLSIEGLGAWCHATCGLPFEGHTDGARCCVNEAEPCIEFLRFPIRDETDVATRRNVLFNVLHDFCHDQFAETLALMLFEHCDVYDLIEATSVANDSAHADRFYSEEDLNGEECAWKASCGSLDRLLAQT